MIIVEFCEINYDTVIYFVSGLLILNVSVDSDNYV